jgi:PIN domain nuclease of toxin-antitoxin system
MKPVDVYLLDTHIWFWLVTGHERLSRATLLLRRMEDAAASGRLRLAAVSVWEVAMLEVKGRLTLGRRCESWMEDALVHSRVQLAPMEPAVSILSTRLEEFPHADPADRIIAATAIENGWRLVTADARLAGYMEKQRMNVWKVQAD